ncbi:MAG TPA: hypothetical protein P5102_05585 [Candidatus Competibacteraceae bacterium]|jgi:hypothetical protein|nr:hypothetical protein [Candidatus Competibacteraceae bacterium]HRZ05615.1 hypothetical protein [Candidatus Competibacteraceae bacterium]HSA46524.1 hypothetical protein [Candidatus Competibacteraceae bacterium]
MSIRDIQEAIRAELDETPSYYDFQVQNFQKDSDLWRIMIDPSAVFSEGQRVNVVLDDFFEGYKMIARFTLTHVTVSH